MQNYRKKTEEAALTDQIRPHPIDKQPPRAKL